MSVQAALAFLGRARREDALRAEVAALGPACDAAALVALGAEAGHAFDEAALQHAHALDWRLRRARYVATVRGAGPPPSGAPRCADHEAG